MNKGNYFCIIQKLIGGGEGAGSEGIDLKTSEVQWNPPITTFGEPYNSLNSQF